MITDILYLIFALKYINFDLYWFWFTIGEAVELFLYSRLLDWDYKKHISDYSQE